jgi:chemosensory pili system protein ChpC
MRSHESSSAQISCLLLPMKHTDFLLPNTSVAEIIEYSEPTPLPDGPVWLAGHIQWRGQQVPLVQAEAMDGNENNLIREGGRIAVTNGVGEHHQAQPFIAFVTRGLPRLVKVKSEEIAPSENVGENKPGDPVISMYVTFSGEEVIIPDLEYMEQCVYEAVKTA